MITLLNGNNLMKAVYIKKPGKIELEYLAIPSREKNEVLIKVKEVGICGTEIAAFNGNSPSFSYPGIIGHEVVGEVIEVEKNNDLRVGDRVVVKPYKYCGSCYPCKIGKTNCCENLKVLGVQTDGAMKEYLSYPLELVYKIPSTISWTHATIIEPLSIALHVVNRAKIEDGQYVVIMGAGTIGNLIAQVIIDRGAIPILVDPLKKRLELANKMGIKHVINPKSNNLSKYLKLITNYSTVPFVIEASGAIEAVKESFNIISYAGNIILVGWTKKELSINTSIIIKKELNIRGSRNCTTEFDSAIKLVEKNKINIEKIITNIVDVEEASDIIKDMAGKPENYMKVVVKF